MKMRIIFEFLLSLLAYVASISSPRTHLHVRPGYVCVHLVCFFICFVVVVVVVVVVFRMFMHVFPNSLESEIFKQHILTFWDLITVIISFVIYRHL